MQPALRCCFKKVQRQHFPNKHSSGCYMAAEVEYIKEHLENRSGWAAGYKYSWRKMEALARDRA